MNGKELIQRIIKRLDNKDIKITENTVIHEIKSLHKYEIESLFVKLI